MQNVSFTIYSPIRGVRLRESHDGWEQMESDTDREVDVGGWKMGVVMAIFFSPLDVPT